MNALNIARTTAWLRIALAAGCLGAAAWGIYVLVTYHDTVYWNVGAGSHVYFYLHIAVYAVTVLAAIVGFISGASAVRSPGTAPGWVFNLALVVLLGLTVWAAAATLAGRAYLV